ncbi:DNA/RNA non-specific endonuclease [Acetatifactor aquisgranensis]|uniref:DNA/RNA non-specific endonuclease n=1 Tax=Acetatifactor aquisgranensis TaxID=2941233 RepID=UPI0020405B59|nr:DNA/RNA non-specific endonuclease [Acetatifactor aquisgranensis]
MRRTKIWLLSVVSSIALLLSACAAPAAGDAGPSPTPEPVESAEEAASESASEGMPAPSPEPVEPWQERPAENAAPDDGRQSIPQLSGPSFSNNDIAPYSGEPYAIVNNNVPYFSESDLSPESFEYYSDLDSLGRCGTAYASIGLDMMPAEERESIGQIKPTGWHTVKYSDVIDGNYLYNRCHLIGYQLTGENANEKNLITGTRYLNVQGMLPFEDMVTDYVKETGNHVLYRATPIFEGDNLLASGVLMEAESVEDTGEGILFCVYAYNVQPNIIINYATGESSLSPEGPASEPITTPEPTVEPVPTAAPEPTAEPAPIEAPAITETQEPIDEPVPQGTTYILNTNTGKFHYPTCGSVKQMKEKNKQEFSGTRDEAISMGYDPCKKCNP